MPNYWWADNEDMYSIDYYSYIKHKETMKLAGKNIILHGVVTIPKEQMLFILFQIRTIALTQWFIVSNMEFRWKAG